jgi:GNAT superfamily N-acetyltransferase
LGVTDLNPGTPRYTPPSPIQPHHRLDRFECGKAPLDDRLRNYGLENEGKASRTFVVENNARDVVAYYTLATGSITRAEVPRKLRQNLSNPVPVMVLGRLAVDRHHAGQRIGSGLLRDAMRRTLRVSIDAGVRALIVHAIDDEAINFYTKYGFQVFPPEDRTLFLPIETLRAAL